MKTYLVTGGAGFIGSHIVRHLVKQGRRVRVLDNFSSGKEANIREVIGCIELIRGDIRDARVCKQAAEGVDFVLHQAALRSVPKSLDRPAEYNSVNIDGTMNMLEASRQAKVKCFVFASSSSIYGDTTHFPQKETDLPRLISPYALTKLAGEYYCKIFTLHYGLPTVCLRYFNVFGPRQGLDDEYAVVIPKFISCMLKDQQPPIYGTGRQSRDFTFVQNVVKANLLAVSKPKAIGNVFNIAGGKDYSILDLAGFLNKIMGKSLKPKFLPLRKGDVFRTNADLTRARKLLGFKPEIEFFKGLEITVKYFKEQNG